MLCRRVVPKNDRLAHFRRHRIDPARDLTGTGTESDPFVYRIRRESSPPKDYADMVKPIEPSLEAVPKSRKADFPADNSLPMVPRRGKHPSVPERRDFRPIPLPPDP